MSHRTVWIPVELKEIHRDKLEPHGTVAEMFAGTRISAIDFPRQKEHLARHVFPVADATDLILIVAPVVQCCNVLCSWVARFGEARVLVYKPSMGKYFEKRISP